MNEETPESIKRIYEKYPDLVYIDQALKEFYEGKEITVSCPTCGELLKVKHIEEIGTIWITCPNNHIVYRAMNSS